MSNTDAGALGLLLAVGGLILLVLVLVGIVFYILMAIGLFTMAKSEKLENPWFAFVPFLNLYIWGKLVGQLRIGSMDIPSPEIVLPVAALISIILGNIAVIGPLISLAYLVLVIIAYFSLYKRYSPNNAILYTVLSIVLPFMGPVFIFMLRNATPVIEV